jgi:integrase
MVIKFTARTVEGLAADPRRDAEYFDTEVPGLCLRVTKRGVKTWSILYRTRNGGRLRRLTLGRASLVSLAEARDSAREALRAARAGADPAADKRQARVAETIGDLVTAYIEQYAKRKKRSWREDDRMLRAEVLPAWKRRAIADITRRDVRALLEAIADRGAPIMANRVLAVVRKMFNFAIDQEFVASNPAARLGRPGIEQSRDRVLTDEELRVFWREASAMPVAMAAFYQLRLVTAQRGAEVGTMRWGDLDLESVDGAWWTIPKERAKNKLAHRVPLSAAAVQLLLTLRPPTAPAPEAFVLAGARGRRQRTEAATGFSLADFTPHDLRRTAATRMTAGGISRLTVSKILNHVERGVTAVYDRHSYDAEKRAALDWWDARLRRLLEAKAPSGAAVLPFAKEA